MALDIKASPKSHHTLFIVFMGILYSNRNLLTHYFPSIVRHDFSNYFHTSPAACLSPTGGGSVLQDPALFRVWQPSINLPANHLKFVVPLQNFKFCTLLKRVVPVSRYLLTLASACADIVCGQCTDLGQSAINRCCAQASPVQCFIDGAGGDSNYITTAAPDSNLSACSVALHYISKCESEIPGFSNLANSDEASCLCYDTVTSWDPLAFDDPYSSCIAWASTADTTAYAGLLSNAGMCVCGKCSGRPSQWSGTFNNCGRNLYWEWCESDYHFCQGHTHRW